MFGTGEIVGLGEWIIYYACLVFLLFFHSLLNTFLFLTYNDIS